MRVAELGLLFCHPVRGGKSSHINTVMVNPQELLFSLNHAAEERFLCSQM
jgi:hypothetical protein